MKRSDDQKRRVTSGIECRTAKRQLERPAHCSSATISEPRTKPAQHREGLKGPGGSILVSRSVASQSPKLSLRTSMRRFELLLFFRCVGFGLGFAPRGAWGRGRKNCCGGYKGTHQIQLRAEEAGFIHLLLHGQSPWQPAPGRPLQGQQDRCGITASTQPAHLTVPFDLPLFAPSHGYHFCVCTLAVFESADVQRCSR